MDVDDSIEELQGATVQGAAALSRGAEVLIRHRQDQQLRRTAETARLTEDMERRAEAQAQAAEQFYRCVDADWVRAATPEDVVMAWRGAHQWRELDPERFTRHVDNLNQRIQDTYGFDPSAGRNENADAAAWRCLEGVRATRESTPEKREEEQRERAEQNREQAHADREGEAEEQAQGHGQDAEPGSTAELEATDAAEHHDAAAAAAQQEAERHGTNTAAAGLDPEWDYDTDQRRAATAQQMERSGVPEQARIARMTADHLNGHHPRIAVTQSVSQASGPAQRSRQQLSRGRDRGTSR